MVDKGIGFEEDQVREIFAPMCTEDFEMVDICYGLPSSVKWFNGEEKDTYNYDGCRIFHSFNMG